MNDTTKNEIPMGMPGTGTGLDDEIEALRDTIDKLNGRIQRIESETLCSLAALNVRAERLESGENSPDNDPDNRVKFPTRNDVLTLSERVKEAERQMVEVNERLDLMDAPGPGIGSSPDEQLASPEGGQADLSEWLSGVRDGVATADHMHRVAMGDATEDADPQGMCPQCHKTGPLNLFCRTYTTSL